VKVLGVERQLLREVLINDMHICFIFTLELLLDLIKHFTNGLALIFQYLIGNYLGLPLVLLQHLLDNIVVLLDEPPGGELQIFIRYDVADIVAGIFENIVVVVGERDLGVITYELRKNECNCFVIVVYLLLLDLLSYLFEARFLLYCLEIIFNHFHLSLSGTVPILYDSHCLSDAVIKR